MKPRAGEAAIQSGKAVLEIVRFSPLPPAAAKLPEGCSGVNPENSSQETKHRKPVGNVSLGTPSESTLTPHPKGELPPRRVPANARRSDTPPHARENSKNQWQTENNSRSDDSRARCGPVEQGLKLNRKAPRVRIPFPVRTASCISECIFRTRARRIRWHTRRPFLRELCAACCA